MKDSLLVLAFWLVALVFGASAEEMLPKVMGVGFPFLLALVGTFAGRRGTPAGVALFALAAGAAEDALSSLPPMTSASAFLVLAVFVRRSGLPELAAVFAYPCYQVWLEIWTGGLGGGVFGRMLLSLPVGFLTAWTVGFLTEALSRKAAIDECE